MNTSYPIQDQRISSLAYRFWEEEGRPEGRAEAHWLRAIAELSIPQVSPNTASATAAKAPKKAKKLK